MSPGVAFEIKSRYAAAIRWSRRGVCGEPGCTDPECGCSLCGRPIGVPEHDPRWQNHDEESCPGCDLCNDQVPIQLFRGAGQFTEMAQFHTGCFEKVLWVRTGCSTAGAPS